MVLAPVASVLSCCGVIYLLPVRSIFSADSYVTSVFQESAEKGCFCTDIYVILCARDG